MDGGCDGGCDWLKYQGGKGLSVRVLCIGPGRGIFRCSLGSWLNVCVCVCVRVCVCVVGWGGRGG